MINIYMVRKEIHNQWTKYHHL